MIVKKIAVVVSIFVVGLIAAYGCVTQPGVAYQAASSAAPAYRSPYEMEVTPLTTIECAQCHFAVFQTIKKQGGGHQIDCVLCHTEYHVSYDSRKKNYDEIMPKCSLCHGSFHGENPKLTSCLDCHVDPHKPLQIPTLGVETLAKYLPERHHVYLNQLPTSIMTTRKVPTQVSWRAPRKTRILSVGVGDFKDTAIPQIDYAESDARGFASLAKSSGIPEENIIHLTNKDAYRNAVTNALIKLKTATTDRSETAIFYFSGHGAPIVKNGKIVDAALVPYDARENSLEYTGIKISTLRELLSDTRGNWIVILDACFSGREGRSLMTKNIKGICVVPKDFTVAPKSTKNNWWITATSGDNFANDFLKENHGLFTYYFLKALNGEKSVDANEDGLISVKEAFNWTKKKVSAVSAKSLGRLQVPELIGKGDTILTIPR